jgi:hypothetical protein
MTTTETIKLSKETQTLNEIKGILKDEYISETFAIYEIQMAIDAYLVMVKNN